MLSKICLVVVIFLVFSQIVQGFVHDCTAHDQCRLKTERLNGQWVVKASKYCQFKNASFLESMETVSNTMLFDEQKSMVRRREYDADDIILPHIPQQLHLSLMNSSSVMVMWVTKEKKSAGHSTIQFGVYPTLNETIVGTSHTYTAGHWIGVIHEGLITGLSANTRYSYRVGDGISAWSYVANFTTPPLSGDLKPIIVGMFGDMGTAIPVGFKVCEQMEADHAKIPFNLLVHVGDISYASVSITDPALSLEEELNDDGGDELEPVWDAWARQVEPLACQIPYMAGVGNHERFYNFSSYLARFRNPLPWGGTPDNIESAVFWFSLDYGRVHFIFMSTEHSYSPGSAQRAWIEQDLAKADSNRANVPWVILTGHRPMYSSDTNEADSHEPGAVFQTLMEPLMHMYHVDLYVCGHMHNYERIHPVTNGTVTQVGNIYYTGNGIPQVVQGTAGTFEVDEFINPQPLWSAFRENGQFGYGRATFVNNSHLHYEYMSLISNEPVDHFWLIKASEQA